MPVVMAAADGTVTNAPPPSLAIPPAAQFATRKVMVRLPFVIGVLTVGAESTTPSRTASPG